MKNKQNKECIYVFVYISYKLSLLEALVLRPRISRIRSYTFIGFIVSEEELALLCDTVVGQVWLVAVPGDSPLQYVVLCRVYTLVLCTFYVYLDICF